MEKKKVLIVGGGFAGVKCALTLEKQHLQDLEITLVSQTPHFEYHAALYRVVTGRSPLEVCIPLSEIFKNKNVNLETDKIVEVNSEKRYVVGESDSVYKYDYLVIAVGSETSYFDTPGLKELSFGFKSIPEALKLKRHIHEEMSRCELLTKDEKVCSTHIVVIGGGASGVELAGELATYMKTLSKQHKIDPSVVTIDLIHSPNRVLPDLPEDISSKVELQLRKLGVNIFLNRKVVKEEVENVYLRDMQMKTKTVVWTAGVTLNSLFENIKGISLSERKRVLVNKYLQAKGMKRVFVLGDCAETPYTGMAQTALYDGEFVAKNIIKVICNKTKHSYIPKPVSYSIPVGPGWAATLWKGIRLYGTAGWFLRRYIDLKFFMSILPFDKALRAFRSGQTVCESCGICDLS